MSMVIPYDAEMIIAARARANEMAEAKQVSTRGAAADDADIYFKGMLLEVAVSRYTGWPLSRIVPRGERLGHEPDFVSPHVGPIDVKHHNYGQGGAFCLKESIEQDWCYLMAYATNLWTINVLGGLWGADILWRQKPVKADLLPGDRKFSASLSWIASAPWTITAEEALRL